MREIEKKQNDNCQGKRRAFCGKALTTVSLHTLELLWEYLRRPNQNDPVEENNNTQIAKSRGKVLLGVVQTAMLLFLWQTLDFNCFPMEWFS